MVSQVIAVVGKTEGNGGVNDFTRILADQAFRAVLRERGTRSAGEIAAIPMVWSGGTDGILTPHATVFARLDGSITNVVRDTVPLSERSVSSSEPAAFVLELNAGTTLRLGIDEDSRLIWEPAMQ